MSLQPVRNGLFYSLGSKVIQEGKQLHQTKRKISEVPQQNLFIEHQSSDMLRRGKERERKKQRDPLRTTNTKGSTKNCSSGGPDPSLQTKRKAHLILLLARHGLNKSKYIYKLFGE